MQPKRVLETELYLPSTAAGAENIQLQRITKIIFIVTNHLSFTSADNQISKTTFNLTNT